MSGFSDYERYDATGLADLVRRRQVSAADLLEAAIDRVQARNGAVNAVTMPLTTTRAPRSPRACPTGRSPVCRF